MWEDLSFKDRSKLIELGASQGILDLSTIKHLYNINADGGYLKWKKEIAKHKGIDIDNDKTYNYQAFFEEDPQRAWDMLKKDSKAHFTDKYKTVWHPTFSDESVYSGHKSKYNPQGLVGGHWEGNTFKMSDSLYGSPVSMDERQQYLIDNEPNGASLLESNDTLPVYDGIPWGGVLPEVTITPQYSDGGSIHIAKNKRGTFKAQASRMGMSTQQAASHILANKDNYSPAMVKKAVFAHNFAHAYGGKMYDDGGVTSSNGWYHVNPTDYLDVLDSVENNKPVEVTLPDLVVTAADPKNYRSSYDPNGFMDFMNLFTLGASNRLSVSQDLRLAKDTYDAILGNKSWKDVFNSAVFGNNGIFDSPYANLALDIVVPTVAGKYRSIANVGKGIYDNGTIWDRYTTFRGRFGNYSDNPFVNVYATTARRFGLPDKARIPADAMRKMGQTSGDLVNIKDGVVDFTGGKSWGNKPHVNFTLDRGVGSHSKGNWDGRDMYIMPTEDFINQTLPSGSLKSIEPTDMFANGVHVTEDPSKVTVISGDIETLKKAQEAGMQTLSSPKLREIYQNALNSYNRNTAGMSPFLARTVKTPKRTLGIDYAREVQRLQGQRGTPTLSDFRLLEKMTGLKSGVTSVSEYNEAIDAINRMSQGVAEQYVYPNGRAVGWNINGINNELTMLRQLPYNNVFYDPASHVEFNWRQTIAHADGGPLESDEDNLLAPIIKYYEDSNPSIYIKDQNTFDKGGQMKRARQAVDYFVNKGLTREQAAGLVGNLMRESGMNIGATNPNSGAYGLSQWLGSRKTRLFKRYGYHPTFEQQLDYIWDELNTSHRRGLQMLRASKTVDDAARNAFGYYEFSAGPEAAIRAMNSTGKNTKWKNPNGTYALNSGIKNAQMIFGEVPVTMGNAGDTLVLDTPESTPNIQPIISNDYAPVTIANLKELPTFGQEENNDSSISSFGPQYLAQNLDRLGMANPLNPFEKGYQLQSPKAIYANMQGLI